MNLLKYLKKLPFESVIVNYRNHYYFEMKSYCHEDRTVIIIDGDQYVFFNRKYSHIVLAKYEVRKFDKLMKVCNAIDRFFGAEFSIFKDNILINDSRLSTLDFFSEFKHPIKYYGFDANQPNFPFTIDKELIDSNVHYFKEFSEKMKSLMRYLKISELAECIEKRMHRKQDYLEIMKKEFGHLDSYIGILVDTFCLSCPTYNHHFYLKFIPLLEKCLKNYDLLPQEYIKLY